MNNISIKKRYKSRSIIAQVAMPTQANPAGNIHGGEIMKMMDNCAYVTAQKHCLQNAVTAAVDEIEFHSPVYVGNLITCTGTLIYTSRSSMLVTIDVVVECLKTGAVTCALTGFFVMVALDASGKPTPVSPLELKSDEDRKIFEEGRLRYEAIKARRKMVCKLQM
ncbi:MAG: acyl-CoA thioesterase [Nitrospirae bacterium]|nr:acyl-CoA thioesterase [Nitrospirota bacterium]MBF0541255.1 acyl-CoA thioesterase [Nitrospirota bacterium]